jgi:adenylylsulfate kinase-like enzyme
LIVWVIGLSGAGKSAIGAALHREMKKDNSATVLIDGDEIRRIFGNDQQAKDYKVVYLNVLLKVLDTLAVRADLLVQVIGRYLEKGELDQLEIEHGSQGCDYYIIHPLLKHIVLGGLP